MLVSCGNQPPKGDTETAGSGRTGTHIRPKKYGSSCCDNDIIKQHLHLKVPLPIIGVNSPAECVAIDRVCNPRDPIMEALQWMTNWSGSRQGGWVPCCGRSRHRHIRSVECLRNDRALELLNQRSVQRDLNFQILRPAQR